MGYERRRCRRCRFSVAPVYGKRRSGLIKRNAADRELKSAFSVVFDMYDERRLPFVRLILRLRILASILVSDYLLNRFGVIRHIVANRTARH
jgi:hypothetical protein